MRINMKGILISIFIVFIVLMSSCVPRAKLFTLEVISEPDTIGIVLLDEIEQTEFEPSDILLTPFSISLKPEERVVIRVVDEEPLQELEEIHVFYGWSDGLEDNPRVITIDSNKKLEAKTLTKFKVTVSTDPKKLIEILGSGWYEKGSSLTLTAPQVEGFSFLNWTVNGEIVENQELCITVGEPSKIEAVYSEIPFRTLSVGSEPEGLKIIIDSLEYTSPWSIQAREGTSHTIEFKAQERDESSFVSGIDTKYTFKSWNDSNTSNPRTVLLDSDKSFTVQTETQYLVETSTLPEGVASIDGAGWKVKDSLFSYVSPDSIGYDFSHWEVNGIKIDGRSVEITHDSPKKIVAVYALKGYSVNVDTEPSGLEVKVNGVKKVAPASVVVNHGDTVSVEIVTPQERDESVNVEGTDTRYSFTRWSDGSTAKARTITATGNLSLTAQMKSEYLVSVSSAVASIPGSGWYEKGSSLTLTAPQVEGFSFLNWTVNGEIVENQELCITVGEPSKIEAVYSEIPFRTLSVGSEPEGLKIIIDSLEYTSPWSIQAREGTSHTIEFKAQERDESSFVSGIDTKYTFKSWNDSNTSNPRTVLLDSDKSFTVQTETQYLVETSTLPEGVASIDGAGWKVKDSLFSYVSPDSIGYDFSHWEVNGIKIDGRSVEITHDSPKKIVAVYALKGYSVNVDTEPSGLEVKVNGVKKVAPASVVVNHGDTVSVEIVTPQERDESVNVEGTDTRYSFTRWSDGSTAKARTITATGNLSLTAQMKSEYLVSVSSAVASIPGSGWYEKGSSLTLTAPQVEGFSFLNWTVNGEILTDNPLQINVDSPKKAIVKYNAIPTLEIPDQTVSTGTNLVIDLRNFASDSDSDPIVFSKVSGVGTISGNQFSYNATTAGTYSVTVRASDGRGGDATDTFSITVVPSNNAPLKPSNPAPSSGTTGIGTSITLSWNCSDPDGDALVYDVYFGTTTNPARVSAGQTAKSYTSSNLTEGTKYYWKVVARDEKGLETAGDLWNFTTKSNQPPAKPSSPNPANNASDVAVSINLSWNCSDPDGDSLKYDVYFGESSNPSKVATGITTKSYNPGNLQNGKDYYWKIVATDAKGATTQGDVWKFRTVAAEIPPEDGIDMNGPVYTGNVLLVSNESESANTSEYTGTLSSDYLPSGDILPKNLPIEAYAINPEIPLPDDVDLSMKMRPDLVEAGFELAAVGNTRSFYVQNFKTNSKYQITATLQYIGETCEIWVENPSEITVFKATQLGQEFDNVIYPLVNEYFYTPSDVNGDGRVAILCFDIQDDFDNTGAYVGGYFSSGDLFNTSTSNKMEIFYIDSYPTMRYPASNPVDVSRAYSTLVHEFQHMVNFNRNYFVEKGSSMPTWLNEGLSMAAEHIYKGTLTSRISYYNYATSIKNGQSLLYWNDNGDVLANYSLSYLFLQYIRTQGGGDPAIFKDILLDSCNDQRAVTAALAKRGVNIGFGDLMTAFRIALLLKKPTGLYGFRGDSSFDGITVSYYTGGAKNLRGGSAVFKTINPSFTDPGNSGSSIQYVGICK